MSYYDQKVRELEELVSLCEKAKEDLQFSAKTKKLELEREIESSKEVMEEELGEREKKLDEREEWMHKLEEGITQMAKERQIGFPWLAKAYEELFLLKDEDLVHYLRTKNHPAISASIAVKEQSKIRRKAEKEKKIAEYIIAYYESIAPFLVDLKEELELPTKEDEEILKDYSEQELADSTTKYLTKEEYRQLPTKEKNQIALDRFWTRPKSNWLIGRLYERYVGYIFEEKGYDVEYVGIFKGFEDLGRDLICRNRNETVIIQCKNWAQFRTIYEKYIFQFFGTVFQYKDENPRENVLGIFYTTTKLSPLARRFSQELKIRLEENHEFNRKYPCIKCNISKIDGGKIYHLPFDQQYDKVKIEKNKGEFYCETVEQAENAGFRRAFRFKGLKKIGL